MDRSCMSVERRAYPTALTMFFAVIFLLLPVGDPYEVTLRYRAGKSSQFPASSASLVLSLPRRHEPSGQDFGPLARPLGRLA